MKKCANCKWGYGEDTEDKYCVNKDSPKHKEWVTGEDSCKSWEKKNV